MLDPLAEPERRPFVPCRLECVERLAVRAVPDRVHADRPPGPRSAADDVGELLAARDPDAGAVEHPRGLRSERAVHEDLEVPDPEAIVTDARPEPERLELGEPLVRDRLPHAQRQALALLDALEDARRTQPAVLVVDRADSPAGSDAQTPRVWPRPTRPPARCPSAHGSARPLLRAGRRSARPPRRARRRPLRPRGLRPPAPAQRS